MRPMNKITITPNMIEMFADYYRKNPTWGSLHIVLDDLNLETSNIEFCVDYAFKNNDTPGYVLAVILKSLTVTQRKKIGRKAEEYKFDSQH